MLNGKIRQNFYDEEGFLSESIGCAPCSEIEGFSVEAGWRISECLESGTVILECKDGKYELLPQEDIRTN